MRANAQHLRTCSLGWCPYQVGPHKVCVPLLSQSTAGNKHLKHTQGVKIYKYCYLPGRPKQASSTTRSLRTPHRQTEADTRLDSWQVWGRRWKRTEGQGQATYHTSKLVLTQQAQAQQGHCKTTTIQHLHSLGTHLRITWSRMQQATGQLPNG